MHVFYSYRFCENFSFVDLFIQISESAKKGRLHFFAVILCEYRKLKFMLVEKCLKQLSKFLRRGRNVHFTHKNEKMKPP
jgi:hypothetical protein